MSQRLIGELKGYSWSGVRPSVVRPSSVVNNFKHLLQNRLPDQSQILCGASLGMGNKICSRHLGHITKMAATPIYGKNPSKLFFSRNLVCRIGDSSPPLIVQMMTLEFKAKSNLEMSAFLWQKVKTVNFSEAIEACDLKLVDADH